MPPQNMALPPPASTVAALSVAARSAASSFSSLVYIGGALGFQAPKIEVSAKTNQIARIVPTGPFHVQSQYTIPMGGILPFGSVCIELAFIMSALWLHQIYYIMGFVFVVLRILVATCAQVSIVLTYLQLCAEDHRWWWSSFFAPIRIGGRLSFLV